MICAYIQKLIDYSIKNELITKDDELVVRNQLMDALRVYDWDGADAYALNVKTRKRQFMVRGVKSATCSNGRAITTSHHNVGINLPVYSFKANGKGKKILDATEIRVSDKCIVYVTIGETGATYKKYSCDLNGENRRYLGKGNGTL